MREDDWFDYPKLVGHIQVTRNGDVSSIKTGERRVLRQRKRKGKIPYYVVSITNNGSVRPYYVHKIVAETFIPNPDNKPCVEHIDANPSNNSVENLRWCTYQENNRNPVTRARMSKSGKKKILSKEHRAKVSASLKGKYIGAKHWNSKPVVQFELDGKVVREWDCVAQICRETGYSPSTIYTRLESGGGISHGFVWKYKNDNYNQHEF